MTGITGECNLLSKCSILVIKRYPIKPVDEETKSIPSMLNNPPIK